MAERSAVDLLSRSLAIAPKSVEEAILRLLVELGLRMVGADEGSLLVLDESGAELVFAMVVGSSSGGPLIGERVQLGRGITGLAAATREVQIGAPTFDVPQAPNVRPVAVIAAPMMAEDELLGVLTAVSLSPGKQFGAADATTYAQLATVAALVIAQRRTIARLAHESEDAGSAAERRLADAVARIARRGPAAVESATRILESAAEIAEVGAAVVER